MGIVGENSILEIKFRYNGRDSADCCRWIFSLFLIDDDGSLHMKQNHPYYIQIILGQLNICKKQKCFLVKVFLCCVHICWYFCWRNICGERLLKWLHVSKSSFMRSTIENFLLNKETKPFSISTQLTIS